MRSYQILITVFAFTLLSACADPDADAQVTADSAAKSTDASTRPPVASESGVRSGKVTETMDASGYTYVKVDDGEESFWAAAPAFEVTAGETVSVPGGMPMRDFHSSALDRDFDVVYFVGAIEVEGRETGALPRIPAGHPGVSAAAEPSAVDVAEIALPDGGQRIGDIVAQKDDLSGKPVSFRGRVVKFNGGILGKNWLHVQDGTGGPGKNDLTVTTSTLAKVGDIVVVSGVLTTDKDFGAGYSYAVIVEDAEVTVE